MQLLSSLQTSVDLAINTVLIKQKTGVSRLKFGCLKAKFTPISLSALLLLTGGWFVGQLVVSPSVQAYTGQLSVAIDVQPGENYDALLRRAEAIARAAAQRSFDRDILVTEVSVVVIAQYKTSTVPILSLEATRAQWRSRPDPRRWATYYGSSKRLLGLDGLPTSTATTSAPTVTITSPGSPPANATPNRAVPASTSIPGRPSASPTSAPLTSTPSTTANPQEAIPPTNRLPGQIIPERIPTPGRIGK